MVERDRTDHADVAGDEVRRVPRPAHAHLVDAQPDRPVGEPQVRERRQRLEVRHLLLALRVHEQQEREQVLVLGGELLEGHVDAAHREPFGDGLEVRRRVQPGGDAVRARELGDRTRRRGLAVRAGDVDRGVRELRVVQERGELQDPREVRHHPGFLATLELAPAPPRTALPELPELREDLVALGGEPRELVLLAGDDLGGGLRAEPLVRQLRAGALDVAVQLAAAASTAARAPPRGRSPPRAGSPRTRRTRPRAACRRPSASRPARSSISDVPLIRPIRSASSLRTAWSASGTPTVTSSACPDGMWCCARNCRSAVTTSCTRPSEDSAPSSRCSGCGSGQAAIVIDSPDAEPLPDLLGHERHDRVQQAERPLEDPRQQRGGVGTLLLGPSSSRPFSSSSPQSQSSAHVKRCSACAASANRYSSRAASTSCQAGLVPREQPPLGDGAALCRRQLRARRPRSRRSTRREAFQILFAK